MSGPGEWTLEIVGDGGHARDIASYADRVTATSLPTIVAFLSHHTEVTEASYFVLGMNDPRDRAYAAAEIGGVGLGVWASARCSGQFSNGVVVAPGVLLLHGVDLGTGVHVNYGATMTRCTIGDFTTIAPGVTICGDVSIGERCLIGAGSTIKNLVTIGNDVTVGCGAVVVKDVPDGATVMGNPAK